MVANERIFQKMKEELEQASKAQVDRILMEVEAIEKRTMASIKEEVKRDADLKLKQELEEMQTNAAAEMSQSHILKTQKLVAQRDLYVKDIFDAARVKLSAFAASADYKDYLQNKIETVKDYHLTSPCVKVKPADVIYQDLFIKTLGVEKVLPDETIKVGGFIVEDKATSIVLNHTLDYQLDDQKEWFTTHSGLLIK